MFWIHGGGYVSGSGRSQSYGPLFYLAHDIIVVTVRYRYVGHNVFQSFMKLFTDLALSASFPLAPKMFRAMRVSETRSWHSSGSVTTSLSLEETRHRSLFMASQLEASQAPTTCSLLLQRVFSSESFYRVVREDSLHLIIILMKREQQSDNFL